MRNTASHLLQARYAFALIRPVSVSLRTQKGWICARERENGWTRSVYLENFLKFWKSRTEIKNESETKLVREWAGIGVVVDDVFGGQKSDKYEVRFGHWTSTAGREPPSPCYYAICLSAWLPVADKCRCAVAVRREGSLLTSKAFVEAREVIKARRGGADNEPPTDGPPDKLLCARNSPITALLELYLSQRAKTMQPIVGQVVREANPLRSYGKLNEPGCRTMAVKGRGRSFSGDPIMPIVFGDILKCVSQRSLVTPPSGEFVIQIN
ncbi:hypothetical protein EVAR_38170_1 [Eumeta japonica]|uniref:Uncharacterized protein n=1 Tax=Eumeta variegata TaxID=151549 RepID=A0A4C1WFX8_EUMVA|nr:hypothetical protein EVAR_38170_1 [Eumeta japonica]